MKTFVPKIMQNDERKWHLIDAKDITLGKLAVTIARIIRGKNKAQFTPHLDLGDYVVVTNIEKLALSGNKMETKTYYKHTGYIGHLRSITAKHLMDKNPSKILFLAVKGMIPHTKLREGMLKRLKMFVGTTHDHEAQQPQALQVSS
jgi:large subunit ribosomal protein L13